MRRFLGVAVANTEKPEMVRDAHLAYIDAGAEVITTNSYACVPKCLEQTAADSLHLKKGGLTRLVAAAGQMAKDACALRPKCAVKVAGSLPPLADSYRPDLVGPFAENVEQYKIIANSIAPFSDYILCETMSTVDEARAAVTAAASTGLPIWVSWTLMEDKPVLRSGESIKDAFEAIKSVEGAKVEACLFNCSAPEIISVAIPMLRDLAPDLRIGAYANGFCNAKAGSTEYRDLSPEQYYEEFASKWIEDGATIIGGCCGVFPRHIAHMTQCLRC
jgi:S-methylmethionine-dependent homocysteine/selenocysteine methylase